MVLLFTNRVYFQKNTKSIILIVIKLCENNNLFFSKYLLNVDGKIDLFCLPGPCLQQEDVKLNKSAPPTLRNYHTPCGTGSGDGGGVDY